MRRFLATLGLILGLAAPAAAFEIEEERLFAADNPVGTLRILSTTDTGIFLPLIAAFQAERPRVSVHYVVASSTEVFAAIYDEGAAFDLVISSAMDLQMKLANDGLAQPYSSFATQSLPSWARWRDHLFGIAQEPVVMLLSRAALGDLPVPRTRSELVRLLREHPGRFDGRVGTYDPARSGAGYLFATQDARQSDSFWRLAEVMGGLSPSLYTTSNGMIGGLNDGTLALAYNVLGSYASAGLDDGGMIVELEDFTQVLLRTALIPESSGAPELGQAFLDFLLSPDGRRLIRERTGLPPIDEGALVAGQHLRPIRLDPGLLVYVDPLKRRRFLNEWDAALIQP